MHAIETMSFPCKYTTKRIAKVCDEIASKEGDYHHGLCPPLRFSDRLCANRAEAESWIDRNDGGFYDSLAVRYKDGRKIFWLVKIEYHT